MPFYAGSFSLNSRTFTLGFLRFFFEWLIHQTNRKIHEPTIMPIPKPEKVFERMVTFWLAIKTLLSTLVIFISMGNVPEVLTLIGKFSVVFNDSNVTFLLSESVKINLSLLIVMATVIGAPEVFLIVTGMEDSFEVNVIVRFVGKEMKDLGDCAIETSFESKSFV
jgi:hypothetical protein